MTQRSHPPIIPLIPGTIALNNLCCPDRTPIIPKSDRTPTSQKRSHSHHIQT
ncbi:hypothetical protein [Dolichospermum sp. UHCC 0259]|uniref:hypothetical protein n=1 Tax=Dolichospermum sp. UHCC 0259 TaxID=2590010 RepID=UPI0014477AED|nr:hypothetical protein [Dolichospermum sp. UHCC 0259]